MKINLHNRNNMAVPVGLSPHDSASDRVHYWHMARQKILKRWIKQYVSKIVQKEKLSLLDVGCGRGLYLKYFSNDYDCAGLEPEISLLKKARMINPRVWQAGLPLKDGIVNEKFDIVLLLDVLEHINDDVAALKSLKQVLNNRGRMIINVPAHGWLWSTIDEVSGHKRRYTMSSITKVVEEAGFCLKQIRYWGSLGLPLVFLQRWLWRARGKKGYRMYTPDLRINKFLGELLYGEFCLTERIKLPFGVSVIMVIVPKD